MTLENDVIVRFPFQKTVEIYPIAENSMNWPLYLVLMFFFCNVTFANVNSFKDQSEQLFLQLVSSIDNYHSPINVSRQRRSASQMGWKLSPEEVKLEFKKYEDCLKKRLNERRGQRHTIKATLALEGQTVRLTCNLCQRPDQDLSKLKIIDWQQLREQDSTFRYVKLNQRIKIDSNTRDLVFESVDVLDAGQYFCLNTYYREYEEIYQLDVLFRERMKTTYWKDILQRKDTVLPPFNIVPNNLKTFTKWSDWSECQDCNKVSVKRKVGLCMVDKIDRDKPVWPTDLPVLELYPGGVPCRSTVLSDELASIKRIKNRRSEICLAECYKKCPTTPAYILITDKSGKVVETIEAGHYSIKNKPTLPPMVKRKVLYEPENKHLILKCPCEIKAKTLIRWQNGTVVLNPRTIRRQTRGRVFIDTVNRLHIRALCLFDTAPYNCWNSITHVATIKVIVTTAMNTSLKEYITYGGLVMTIISVTCICICTCCSSKKKTAK